jgi:CPA1 family monovalent cation:H+ antiporter
VGIQQVELLIGLLFGVAALAWAATRLKISYPILMVIGGLIIGLIPGLPEVQLSPDLIFLLFLPPLLYHAGVETSWRDFRANIHQI